MASICANPYCPGPKAGMRTPTHEEMDWVRGELDRESFDRLSRNEITLQVCKTCSTWVAKNWDNQHNTVVRRFIASPFKFNVGDRFRVMLEGEHQGMVGIVTKRIRRAKTIMPPPPPENVCYIVFRDDRKEYGYGEANLTADAND